MIDAITLDQFRTFVAAVDEQSFSAAGRKIGRAQSVVSQTIANLEDQLRVPLFDRSGRLPSLTLEGQVLLSDAREVIRRVDQMRAKARGMSGGLEAELSVVIDMMFPLEVVTRIAAEFAARFPSTPLRVYTDSLGKVPERILSGQCSLGVMVPLPDLPEDLKVEQIMDLRWALVAAPSHPLAQVQAPIPRRLLSDHTQLILTDQTSYTDGKSYGVVSPTTWKMTDLNTKRAFLVAGLGWGGMPLFAVEDDLVQGRLVVLTGEDAPVNGISVPVSVAYATAALPGPAGRWFIQALRDGAASYGAENDLNVAFAS